MTLIDAAAAAGLWLVVGLAAYGLAAYLALFYLPPADRLQNGVVADAVFVTTAPFMLAMTWLAAVRDRDL